MRKAARTVLAGVGLFLAIGCGGTAAEMEWSSTTDPIVGGEVYTGLPAVGMITRSGSMHCTGTLIEKRKVLTAAHCVDGFSASTLKFAIGPSMGKIEKSIAVSATKFHPNWNKQALINDVGYLTLAEDAPLEPIQVNRLMDQSWIGKKLFFVGYGVDNGTSQSGAGTKRSVWIPLNKVDPTLITYNEKGKSPCNGDSGGPAFYVDADGSYFVTGITSYGDWGCNGMGASTRVDAFLDFIAVTTPPPPDGLCQGETAKGRCDGSTLIWCENQQIKNEDCAASGEKCLLDPAQDKFLCLTDTPTPPPPVDGCNGETAKGRCDIFNTAIWCENGTVQKKWCGFWSQCGLKDPPGKYDCI